MSNYKRKATILQKLDRTRLTDVGNAKRFVAEYESIVKHCDELGWLVWNGKKWEAGNEDAVLRMADKLAEKMYREAEQMTYGEDRDLCLKHAKASMSLDRINAMIAKAKPYLKIGFDELDQYPNLFNVDNGTINTETGGFISHQQSKGFFLTKISPVKYRKNAKCKEWLKHREHAHPDEETRRFIQKAAGYSLTGHTDEKCLFFPQGQTGTGKTTLLRVMEYITGEYGVKGELESITNMRRGGVTAHLDHLRGARFVSLSETEESRLNTKAIKDLTGFDRVTVNPKYKPVYSFLPEFKLWLVGNHLPTVNDSQDALWRRIHLIPFNHPVKKVMEMSEAMSIYKRESSGILNWMLEGERLRRAEGLKPSKEIEQATQEYRKGEDNFSHFLESFYELAEKERTETTIFLADYNAYRKANGMNTVSQQVAGKRLQDHHVFPGGAGRMYYLGIRKLSVDERLQRGLPVPEDEQTNDTLAKLFEDSKPSNEFENIANKKSQ
jgi:putative DNA primase/helicase